MPRYGFTPDQIQTLTPVNKNELGARNLNFNLQQQLNPYRSDRRELTINGTTYRIGDRVMQITNNYDKDVYNGEMGVVVDIATSTEAPKSTSSRKKNKDGSVVSVQFDRHGETVLYPEADMDQIILSYAVTIHKSQGNEFPVTIIPLHHQHKRMLQRNLLYTAVTRGKRLVILVGTKSALQIAVDVTHAEGEGRFTNLAEQITTSYQNKE